jgi:hypothetical protein
VDGIYKTLFILCLVLGVVYVVRGRRRGDGPRKILDDSLPVASPLFFPSPIWILEYMQRDLRD